MPFLHRLPLAVSLRTVSQMNGEVTNVLSMRPDPDSLVKGKHYALVETPSGRVHCYTRDFVKLLNVPPPELYNFLLKAYIPNFLETMEQSIEKPITCSVGKDNNKVLIELSTRKLLTESLVFVSMLDLSDASPEVSFEQSHVVVCALISKASFKLKATVVYSRKNIGKTEINARLTCKHQL